MKEIVVPPDLRARQTRHICPIFVYLSVTSLTWVHHIWYS